MIEVGEYVRNTFGDIYIYDYSGHPMLLEDKFYNRVVKHSKNIIDLIEIGDIVKDKYNKYEVAFVKDDKIYCNDYNLDDSLITLREQDIKAILGREQFEAKCYKVGGEDE